MQGAYGGLVVILIYGTFESGSEDSEAILIESNLPILTEVSDEIYTE